MNPKDIYHPKSIFRYINETPVRQKHSLQNANTPGIRRFGEKPQPNERSETKLHTGNASQSVPPFKQQAERPPSRLPRTIPRPTMEKSTTRLMLPSVETLNSIDITTNSLQEAFGQPNGIPHNTNQPWCTTNAVKDVHEERKVQPTSEKLKGNLILNHRKPPDSTIVPPNNPHDVSTNDFTERTTRDGMSMPTTSTSTEMNSKKLMNLQHRNLQKESNNNSIDRLHKPSAKNLVKDFNELIHSRNLNIIKSLFPAIPAKRILLRDLDREWMKLDEESETIYSSTHPPIDQINSIQLKLMIHECKRALRLGRLGGSNPNSNHYKSLQRQLGDVTNSLHEWLNKLCAYSLTHEVDVTINRSAIEDVDALASLQIGLDISDTQVEWNAEKASAVFAVLKQCAKARKLGPTSNEKFEDVTSIRVSPSPDGPFIISLNNTPRAATVNYATNIPDATSVTLDAKSCPSSFETIK